MPSADESSMSVDIPYLDVVYSQHSTSIVPKGGIPSFVGILPIIIISTAPVERQLSMTFLGRPVFGFCLQSTLSQYCAKGQHNSLIGI